jgi:hypothetical protein
MTAAEQELALSFVEVPKDSIFIHFSRPSSLVFLLISNLKLTNSLFL